MITCPKCGHRFPQSQATQDAFELFHVIVDAYAEATGHAKPYAKDELCVLYGVSVEYEGQSDLPPWPMVACRVWDRKYLRKSTLAYTKDEMRMLIDRSTNALYDAGGMLPVRSSV